MTEEELQQLLNKTSGFQHRQRLLKELWKLRRAREEGATVERPEQTRSSSSPQTAKAKEADSLVA